MAKTFSVTSSSSTVSLSRGADTEVRFVVTNTRDDLVRGRAIPVAMNGAEDEWLTIDGDVERDFGEAQTDDFIVSVSVPSKAAEGRYALRLDMVAVDNPDEDYTAGPEVGIAVGKPASPSEPVSAEAGYIATVVGTAAGVLAGLIVGGGVAVVGLTLAGMLDNPAEVIETLLVAILVFLPGPWIGAIIGSRVALGNQGYACVRPTSMLMAGVYPVWALLTITVLSSLSGSDNGNNALLIVAGVLIPPLWALIPAMVSRFAAIRFIASHQ